MTTLKPKRRWYQFSMRTLLVVMVVFVVGVGWVCYRVRRAQTNRDRVVAIAEASQLLEGFGLTASCEGHSTLHNRALSNCCLRPEYRPTRSWLEAMFDDPGGDADAVCGVGPLIYPFPIRPRIVAPAMDDPGRKKLTVRLERLGLLSKVDIEHLETVSNEEFLHRAISRSTVNAIIRVGESLPVRFVRLSDSRITAEDVKKLQQALPNCKFIRSP
jgi:hypothetical protein